MSCAAMALLVGGSALVAAAVGYAVPKVFFSKSKEDIEQVEREREALADSTPLLRIFLGAEGIVANVASFADAEDLRNLGRTSAALHRSALVRHGVKVGLIAQKEWILTYGHPWDAAAVRAPPTIVVEGGAHYGWADDVYDLDPTERKRGGAPVYKGRNAGACKGPYLIFFDVLSGKWFIENERNRRKLSNGPRRGVLIGTCTVAAVADGTMPHEEAEWEEFDCDEQQQMPAPTLVVRVATGPNDQPRDAVPDPAYDWLWIWMLGTALSGASGWMVIDAYNKEHASWDWDEPITWGTAAGLSLLLSIWVRFNFYFYPLLKKQLLWNE